VKLLTIALSVLGLRATTNSTDVLQKLYQPIRPTYLCQGGMTICRL